MRLLSLYAAFVRLEFLRQTQYRSEYIMRMFTKTIMWSTGFLMLYVLLYNFKSLGIWNVNEVMFLYAFNVLTYSVASMFFNNPFESLAKRIHSGEFDSVLTKPVNPFVYYIVRGVSAGYMNNFVICIVVMYVCWSNLSIAVTPAKILYFILALLGGALIHASAYVITNVPAFWLLKNKSIQRLFYDQLGRSFMEYPLSIFNRGIQIMLTFILPYAFVSFYPTQYIIGKEDLLGLPSFFVLLTPVVGLLMFCIAYWFWNLGINHYKSTGS